MSSRLGVIVVDLILLAFLVGLILGFFAGQVAAASRPAPVIPAVVAVGPGQPDQERTEPPRALVAPPPRAAAQREPEPRLEGIASWGRGWTGVVTRLPRGTRIRVCGHLGCWSGSSVGYGPARWTHRIADLSPAVFVDICGRLSRGLCRVTVTIGG